MLLPPRQAVLAYVIDLDGSVSREYAEDFLLQTTGESRDPRNWLKTYNQVLARWETTLESSLLTVALDFYVNSSPRRLLTPEILLREVRQRGSGSEVVVEYEALLDRIRGERVSRANFDYLLEQLEAEYLRGELITVAISLVDDIKGRRPGQAFDLLRKKVASLDRGSESTETGFTLRSISDSRWDLYQDKKKFPEKYRGIPTGFHSLDRLTNGFRAGELVVWTSRTSQGKSMILLNLAANMYDQGHNVVFVTREMQPEQQQIRLEALQMSKLLGGDGRNRISTYQIRDALLDEDLEGVYRESVLSSFSERQNEFYIVPPSRCATTLQLSIELDRVRDQFKPEVLVVDYIHVMSPGGIFSGLESSSDKFHRVALDLVDLGRELGVPVITAAQSNRASLQMDYKGTEVVALSDWIPNTADVVLFFEQDRSDDTCVHVQAIKARNLEKTKFDLVADWARGLVYEPIQQSGLGVDWS